MSYMQHQPPPDGLRKSVNYLVDNEILMSGTRKLGGSLSTSMLHKIGVKKNRSAIPIISLVRRNESERAAHPERLTLQGQGLLISPTFENEHQLQLLSFENNFIRVIERLTLPNLIYLDFHNNSLESISGLDNVPSLRVLLLGKNNIKAIQNLEHVPLLDVLDLHSNNISRIENIQHLKSLRVLNLQHNGIKRMAKLSGMSSLIEVNLAHNHLSICAPMKPPPYLSRLFLSHNKIDSVSSVDEMCAMKSLKELTLKWNPITSDLLLMQHLAQALPKLEMLDVWGGGRTPLPSIYWPDITQEGHPAADSKINPVASDMKAAAQLANNAAHACIPKNASWSVTAQKIQDWWDLHHDHLGNISSVDLPSYYKFEETKTRLVIYGYGFEALDLEDARNSRSVAFNYAHFNTITLFLNTIVTWPKLTRLDFSYNNIWSFRQLQKLSILTQVRDVSISMNPIVEVPLHRQYLISTMKDLAVYNGTPVTKHEIALAEKRFGNCWLLCNPRTMRTRGFASSSASCSSREDDPQMSFSSHASLVCRHVVEEDPTTIDCGIKSICKNSTNTARYQTRVFDDSWQNSFTSFVRECIEDRSRSPLPCL